LSRAEKYSLVEGSIVNKLFLVAGPIILTQIFQMAYNLTDMFWLGRLSSDAVAASGTAGMYLWLSMAFFLFGRMGAEIGVSQNLGRKDIDAARAYAQNSITFGLIGGLFIASIFILFHTQLIGLFQIREEHVAREAAEYLAIVSISLPISFTSAAINGIFVGAGNSRTSLMVSGFGFILNMLLDPILIFTAGLGIHGAAMATVIAQSLTICLAIIMLLKSKNRPFEKMWLSFKPDKAIFKQIIKWVTPVSLESLLFSSLSMMLTPLVANYGAGALATVRVGSQIESLTWLIAGGYAAALTAFTGQNFGAEKWTRINKGFKISTIIMSLWGLLIAFVLYFGGGILFGVFIPDEPEVIKMGIHYLQVLAFVQIPACLEGVAAGIFRGKGKTLPPSIVSITSNILRVIFAYGFIQFTDLGLTGIWIAVAASAALRGTCIFIWYVIHSRKEPKTDSIENMI